MDEVVCYFCKRTREEYDKYFYDATGVDYAAESEKSVRKENELKDRLLSIGKEMEGCDSSIERDLAEIELTTKDIASMNSRLSELRAQFALFPFELLSKFGTWTGKQYASALDCNYPFEGDEKERIKFCFDNARPEETLSQMGTRFSAEFNRNMTKTKSDISSSEEHIRKLRSSVEDRRSEKEDLAAEKEHVQNELAGFKPFVSPNRFFKLRLDINNHTFDVYECPICHAFNQAHADRISALESKVDGLRR